MSRRRHTPAQISENLRQAEVEKENARLKKLVAEQALDIAILKEAASANL